jgi:2,4-dienoyl-CoA reductase (NADPH2)
VTLHQGQRVTAEVLLAAKPAVAFVAVGTKTRVPTIEGIEHPMVLDAFDVLMGDAEAEVPRGGRIVVYGGGETGCETAEFFAERGVAVILVSRSRKDQLARSAEMVYRIGLLKRLTSNPAIEIVEAHRVTRVAAGEIAIESEAGETRILRADWLLLAQGRDSASTLAEELVAAGALCHVVGDSRQGGRIGDAVHASYQAMRALSAQDAGSQSLAC